MSDNMEQIMQNIFLDRVPPGWAKLAYPSTRGLVSWLANLSHRLQQLNTWKDDPQKNLNVCFINRLFNPQSFLTAIKQVYAEAKEKELNKLIIRTDVQKRLYWEAELQPLKDSSQGAYIFGMQVEGARWDNSLGQLEESYPKKQFSVVPVVLCCAADMPPPGKEEKGVYQCPVYQTTSRGATYVFDAQLKTKQPPAKWILAGVAVILDVEGVSDRYIMGSANQPGLD